MSPMPAIVGAVVLSISGVLCVSRAAGDEPIAMQTGLKQLFLDDFVVQEMQGVRRTMHQPEKKGPVFRPYIALDGRYPQTRSAPVWIPEESVYKMFYCPGGTGVLISKDGLHWERPSLGLFAVKGSKDNNRIASLSMYQVVRDPDDPDLSRRYKGMVHTAAGLAPYVSGDLTDWKKLDVPPIPSSDEASLTYDREHKRFIAMVKTGNQYGRAFSIALSEDFNHWTNPRFCFGADAADQPLALKIIRQRVADPALAHPVFVDPDPALGGPRRPGPPTWRAECYYITVFPYEGMYIGLPTMFYPTGVDSNGTNCDGFDLIQLAVTRDLINWNRLGNRKPFIPPGRIDHGRVGVWDRMQMFATNPVERGDELWIYYSALKWRDDRHLVLWQQPVVLTHQKASCSGRFCGITPFLAMVVVNLIV